MCLSSERSHLDQAITTMVPLLRSQAKCLVRVAHSVLMAALVWLGLVAAASAQQQPPVHLLNAGMMPPGAIGNGQLLRGGPLPGYFQPVEIVLPPGALVSTATQGEFDEPQSGPVIMGVLIAGVYRLRVTNMPNQPALEVYPTIEVIDRLYPPVGMEGRFPIVIHLAQEDLELALAGKFVTRIVYLEDPDDASPLPERPLDQPYFEIAQGARSARSGRSLGPADGHRFAWADACPMLLARTRPSCLARPCFLRFTKQVVPEPVVPRAAGLEGPTLGAIPRNDATYVAQSAAGPSSDRRGNLPPLPKRSRLNMQNAFRQRATAQ